MTTDLPLPLESGFFPQMVLTVDDLMHYRRVGKERVAQLMRVIDDVDCIYCWKDLKARNNRSVQKAQFLDIQLSTKQPALQQASTIYKSSVHLVDVQAEEILQAIAKVKTRDARRVSRYLYRDDVLDTQTLLTFPTSSDCKKPSYSYRAIKWCLLKGMRKDVQKCLDFCYLEYAGKRKARATANSVVGFCIQESIAKNREVPTLEHYNILRGQFVRTGFVITKTHQSNILKVTAIAQVDGALESAAVRTIMEEIMIEYVTAVHRVKGLIERQRMGKLHFLDEWDWIPGKERKACAVCLRGFYLHWKYHCATCGEVVCSKCAPLRELEEPLDDQTHALRVCSVCMAQASGHHGSSLFSRVTESEEGLLESTTGTTNVGTETYINGLRYPKHRGVVKDVSLRRSISPRHSLVSSHSSSQYNEMDIGSKGSVQHQRAASEAVRRGHHATDVRHLTLSSPGKAETEALSKLVQHVRQIRDTINVAISEAEEVERHGMLLTSGRTDDAGADRFNEINDRFMKLRDTLDISSSDLENALESINGIDRMRPSNTTLDPSDKGSALSYAESEHSISLDSERFELHSPRSSLLSASARSLEYQDAGEPLPSPRPVDENPVNNALALEKAIQWTRYPDPVENLYSTGIPTSSLVPPVVNAKNRGIERLAQKIDRLHQRLEAPQTENKVPIVDGNTNDEPEPESQVSGPLWKPYEAIANSSSSIASRKQPPRVPDPSRVPPDLVANLRGVMNSSELTHAPPRRRTAGSPSLSNSSRRFNRAPPPPRPAMPPMLSAYEYDSQHQLQRVHQRSRDQSHDQESQAVEASLDEASSRNDRGEKAFLNIEERTAAQLQSLSRLFRNGDRDESSKLRELMEELAKAPLRSRCSSGQSTGAPPGNYFFQSMARHFKSSKSLQHLPLNSMHVQGATL